MKITLFCIGSNFTCIGPRRISSYLRSKGIKVKIVFVQTDRNLKILLEGDCKKDLLGMVKDDIAVGMSFTSNYLNVAETLTALIKKHMPIPVIWGGVHATVSPEESLNVCDAVCLGEGEDPILEFLEGGADIKGNNRIDNIWLRSGDQIIKNKQRPLRVNLDRLPYQDYDIENHFILENQRLRHLQRNDLKRNYGFSLTRMMTFGCPFSCTYCVNSRYKSLDKGNSRIRSYSVDYFIGETKDILNRLPFISYLLFDDDAFLSLSSNAIEEFCQKYKREIGLPFGIGGIKAEMVKKEKLAPLVEAGLITVRMGIQTASEKTNRNIFHRQFSREENLKAVQTFKSLGKKIRPPFYDLILDNPWEDTDDKLETLDFFRSLPLPYFLNVFSLTFFPGTELYKRALTERLIGNYDPYRHYHDFKKTYLNLMILFSSLFKLPDSLYKRLARSKRIRNQIKEYPFFYYIYKTFDLLFRLMSYYTNRRFIAVHMCKRRTSYETQS